MSIHIGATVIESGKGRMGGGRGLFTGGGGGIVSLEIRLASYRRRESALWDAVSRSFSRQDARSAW